MCLKYDDGCCTNTEGTYNCLKNILILYNFFFALLGFSLIGLGVYAEYMRAELMEIEHFLLTPSVLLFLMGFLVSCFAVIGCTGALRDNFCLLKTFHVAIVFCVILELVAGILAFIFKEPAKSYVNHFILLGMTTYYDDHDFKNIMDYFQANFNCCGGLNYKDWEINIYHNCSSPGPAACGVPYSCCVPDKDGDFIINSMCGYDTLQLSTFEAVHIIYVYGCIDAVLDFIWSNLDIFGGILLGVFLPQLTGILLCVLYMNTLKKAILENQQINLPEGGYFLN